MGQRQHHSQSGDTLAFSRVVMCRDMCLRLSDTDTVLSPARGGIRQGGDSGGVAAAPEQSSSCLLHLLLPNATLCALLLMFGTWTLWPSFGVAPRLFVQ